jgi:hypothetical protein
MQRLILAGSAARLRKTVTLGLVALTLGTLALNAPSAFAGTDTTFNTALTTFTNFLQGSGGKVITLVSLVGGIVAMAAGNFSIRQIAIPVGTGVAVGTGVPIVTSVITAVI